MAQRISVAQAKAQLSALMAQTAYGGQRFIIERRGKPLAALVSIDELRRLEDGQTETAKPRGALALVGAWGDALTNEEIDAFTEDVYAAREREMAGTVDSSR